LAEKLAYGKKQTPAWRPMTGHDSGAGLLSLRSACAKTRRSFSGNNSIKIAWSNLGQPMTRFWSAPVVLIVWTFFASALGGQNQAATQHKFDVTSKYATNDLIAFLKPRSAFIGFIGTNYQRLQIVFTSLKRDTDNPNVYRVAGYDIVMKNRCDISGEITISRIEMGAPNNYDEEGGYDTAGRKWQGTIEARYQLREDPSQKNGGVFEGTMSVDVYINAKDRLVYDDLDSSDDGYDNDRYTGTWTKYGPKPIRKTANWGEWRVPNSGDLDGGAGEFDPIDKYRHNGWDDYHPPGG
jgi:hypothetical protein